MKNPEIYHFSKEHSQEQRDRIAREIREKRAGYFERKKTHNEEINILETETTEKEREIARITQEIKKLDDYLDNLNENILSRISHFLEIKKTREAIWPKKSLYRVGSQELAQLNNLLTRYREQQLDRRELAEAKEILGEFWQGQSEAWQEYQEEEKTRDLKNVCLNHDCAIVHCLHPGFTPEVNSILDQGATWQDKLKIFLALEPVVSASTVHQGDNGNINLFSKMGLILSGGRVQFASPQDAATVVTKDRERVSRSYQDLAIKDQIQTFIKYKEKDKSEKNSDDLVAQDTQWIKLACCHLYGFGEEAIKQGDQETQAKVIEIANQYYPYQEYQKLVNDRLDERGNFRLTRKDLALAA